MSVSSEYRPVDVLLVGDRHNFIFSGSSRTLSGGAISRSCAVLRAVISSSIESSGMAGLCLVLPALSIPAPLGHT